METKEVMLYAVTIISFIAFVYIFFGAVSKIPNISDEKFMSLTGNAVLDLGDSFKVGDNIKGNIIINKDETNAYGILLLTKDDKPLITKTFNLNEIPKNKIDAGKYSIKIEDLIDYKFNQTGNYELLFSVLDLNINIKREFMVK
jgi:hypothetical protein